MTAKEKMAYNNIDSATITGEVNAVQYKKSTKVVQEQSQGTAKKAQKPAVQYAAPKPKKPLTPYICFITENSKKISEAESISYKEAFTKSAKQWSEMTDE